MCPRISIVKNAKQCSLRYDSILFWIKWILRIPRNSSNTSVAQKLVYTGSEQGKVSTVSFLGTRSDENIRTYWLRNIKNSGCGILWLSSYLVPPSPTCQGLSNEGDCVENDSWKATCPVMFRGKVHFSASPHWLLCFTGTIYSLGII